MRGRRFLAGALVLVAACSVELALEVESGTYSALVPTEEQFSAADAADLPGGFAALRSSGEEEVRLIVDDDAVTFILGAEVVERRISERKMVRDAEGSGPLRGRKQVLVLDPAPLVLGQLRIDEPVLWPGSFSDSPIVVVKQWNPDDRGPAVTCSGEPDCLLLSLPVEPTGSYEDANNPALGENPIDIIDVGEESVVFLLDTGERVTIARASASSTTACGLRRTALWDVPPAVAPGFDDPVLAHTLCPSNPGAAIRLVILARADLPVLAPLGEHVEGWCDASPQCLWFAPI